MYEINKASYSHLDLVVEVLVDNNEMEYYQKLKPIAVKNDIPTYDSEEVKLLAMKVYKD